MELDIEQPGALLAYLQEHDRLPSGVIPRITALPGGVSSRTMLVEFPDGTGWVVKQALPRLRVATEWLSDPRRIEREGLALRWMPRVLGEGVTPGCVFEDAAHHVLAMTAVPQPRVNWKTRLLAGEVEEALVLAFATILGRLHSRGRGEEVAAAFEDRAHFDSLRLQPYYRFTAERHPSAREFFGALIEETLATRCCLVHGDYSPKNTLVRGDGLVLLDFEVMHFGDPAFDVGFALAHLFAKARHVPDRRDRFVAAVVVFWQRYLAESGQETTGGEFEARVVRHALACLLARVDGRSPLEYLTEEERSDVRALILGLVAKPPISMTEFIPLFVHSMLMKLVEAELERITGGAVRVPKANVL